MSVVSLIGTDLQLIQTYQTSLSFPTGHLICLQTYSMSIYKMTSSYGVLNRFKILILYTCLDVCICICIRI